MSIVFVLISAVVHIFRRCRLLSCFHKAIHKSLYSRFIAFCSQKFVALENFSTCSTKIISEKSQVAKGRL